MDIIESLGRFGLTNQEAKLYLILTSEGELSGYEAARLTGISRSNAYAALAALTEKGAAYRLDGETPRYQAVAIGEFCGHQLRGLQATAEYLRSALPGRRPPAEAYLTIQGRQNILDRLHSMIEGAQERIYLALPAATLDLLRLPLQEALRRGIKLVIISDADPALDAAVCHRHAIPANQVRLIADSREVLTGEFGPTTDASCLYSKRKQLVDLFKDALRNEIKLIELEAS